MRDVEKMADEDDFVAQEIQAAYVGKGMHKRESSEALGRSTRDWC
jgi:hypothetical protein